MVPIQYIYWFTSSNKNGTNGVLPYFPSSPSILVHIVYIFKWVVQYVCMHPFANCIYIYIYICIIREYTQLQISFTIRETGTSRPSATSRECCLPYLHLYEYMITRLCRLEITIAVISNFVRSPRHMKSRTRNSSSVKTWYLQEHLQDQPPYG